MCQLHPSNRNYFLLVGVKITPFNAPCATLDDPSSGSVTTYYNSTVDLFVAEYTCEDGFTVVGDNQRYCYENMYWSGAEPYCIAGKLHKNELLQLIKLICIHM